MTDTIIQDQQEFYDEGITYAIRQLAELTGAKDWRMKDGSEDHATDVRDTIMDVLKCAGLYDDETGKFAMRRPTAAEIAQSEASHREAAGESRKNPRTDYVLSCKGMITRTDLPPD